MRPRRADVAAPVPVDIYRRPGGALLIHSCPNDKRAVPGNSTLVGRALLQDERWTRRIGCPLSHAKGALVPHAFAAELIAEIHVLGC